MDRLKYSPLLVTPYHAFPTPEVVAARDTLSALIAGDEEAARGSLGDLVVWSTIELAQRLSTFVTVNDGLSFGAALEELAYGLGIVRAARPIRSMVPTPVGRGLRIREVRRDR